MNLEIKKNEFSPFELLQYEKLSFFEAREILVKNAEFFHMSKEWFNALYQFYKINNKYYVIERSNVLEILWSVYEVYDDYTLVEGRIDDFNSRENAERYLYYHTGQDKIKKTQKRKQI